MDGTVRAVAGASAIWGIWLGVAWTPDRVASIGAVCQCVLAAFVLLPALAEGEYAVAALLAAAAAAYLAGRASRRRRALYVLGAALTTAGLVLLASRTGGAPLLLFLLLLPGLALPLAVTDPAPRERRRRGGTA